MRGNACFIGVLYSEGNELKRGSRCLVLVSHALRPIVQHPQNIAPLFPWPKCDLSTLIVLCCAAVMTVLALVGVAVNLLLMAIIGGHHHPHGSTSHSHSHSHSHSQSDDKLPARSLSTVEEGVAEDEEHAGPAAPRGSAVNGSHAPLLEQGGEGQEPGMRHTHAHAHNLGTDPGSDPPAARESRSTHSSSMNMHGAFIHAVGDLLQSLGVAAAGGLIWWHQDDARWAVADPLCTFFFAAIVLWTTLAILRDIGDVLMERTPRGICVATVGEDLRKVRQHALLLLSSSPLFYPFLGGALFFFPASAGQYHGTKEAGKYFSKINMYSPSAGYIHP